MRAALALAWLLAAATLGCGSDDAPSDAGPPPSDSLSRNWLEVGAGYDRFVPYTEPATGELIAGPQGGFHIWTSLRARNPATTMSPLVEITYERVRDGAVVSYPFRVRVSFDRVPGTDVQEIYGLRAEALTPEDVLDEDVIVRARVETRDGAVAFAEQRVHVIREIVPPPGFDGGSAP
jgi:hypothetical protein